MKPRTAAIIVHLLLINIISFAGDAHGRLTVYQICQDGVLNPLSPEMWTMFRFGDNFQVNPNQGTLGLSIPVYHYSDERFDLPVDLCYNNAGGYRPSLSAGPIGLGWTLSCLGAITREVRGIADEEGWITTDLYDLINKFHGYDDSNLSTPRVFGWGSVYDTLAVRNSFPGNYSHTITIGYIRDFAFSGKAGAEYMPIWSHASSVGYNKPCFETLPDIFHFSFLGRSGSFVLQQGKQVVVYGTEDSPNNYTVTANLVNGIGFKSFSIKTEDNYIYTFGDVASAIESATSSNGLESITDVSLASSWRLTSIEAPDGRTVSFTYGNSMTSTTKTPTYTYDYADYYEPGYPDPPSDQFRNVIMTQTSATKSEVQSRLLTEITITGRAVINFTYSTACGETGSGGDGKKLSGIEVRSLADSSVVRTAVLGYHLSGQSSGASYPTNGSGVTFLSSVSIPGIGVWSMHYDSETASFPAMDTKAIDWMGFYNGASSQDFCPSPRIVKNPNNRSWMISMRSGNLACSRMGMLSSITYPTGGRSDFEYELNDYSQDVAYTRPIPSGKAAGYGIRISRIYNRDADGHLKSTRSFSYVNTDNSSSGTLLWRPTLYTHYEMRAANFNKITRTNLSTADSFPYSRGVFTEYSRVLETIEGGPGTVGASITERTYESFNAPVCRDNTDDWEDGYSFVFGGSWSFQLGPEDPVTASSRQLVDTYLQSRKGGRILSEKEYSDDLYHPVHGTVYSYDTYSQSGHPLQHADMQYGHVLEYHHSLQDPWICQISETEYSPSGTVILSRVTTKTLDSNFRLATEQFTDSAGKTVQTTYSWLTGCPSFLSQLIVARDGVLEEGVKRLYNTIPYHSDLYVPYIVQSADPGGNPASPTWRNEQTCNNWSPTGQPLEICDKAGVPTSLVWAWNGMYLAAKVTGKHFSDLTTADSSLLGGLLPGNLSVSQENALRALSGAVVTTYRWTPLVGLVEIHGESGKATGYTYDSAGRLSSERNDAGNTLRLYEYNIYSNNQ